MSQPNKPAMITLKGIEVGGLRLPVLNRVYNVDGLTVSLRYSKEPYLALYCRAPYRRANVAVPDNTSKISIQAWQKPASWQRQRSYHLTGTAVDESVKRICDATTVEEIGTILTPLVKWVATAFRIVS